MTFFFLILIIFFLADRCEFLFLLFKQNFFLKYYILHSVYGKGLLIVWTLLIYDLGHVSFSVDMWVQNVDMILIRAMDWFFWATRRVNNIGRTLLSFEFMFI